MNANAIVKPTLSLSALALLGWTATAFAQMDYVTDNSLCAVDFFDRSERGMSFDGKFFVEIEYFCEIANEMPDLKDGKLTHISPGYCEEPGALYPTVFVLRAFKEEPGVLYVYEGDDGEAQVFFQCHP